MRGYKRYALNTLKKLKNGESITQVELTKKVCKKFNTTRPRVVGTIFGTTPVKLYGCKEFKNNFEIIRNSRISIFKKPVPPIILEKVYHHNYVSPIKQKVREIVYKSLEDNSKILTMGAEDGLDIKYAFSKYPNAKIYNVERFKEVLNEYKRNNLPTIDILAPLDKAIDQIPEQLDFIYYDSIGYACESMNNILCKINSNKKSKKIALTISNIKKFRNHGKWAEWARNNFKSENPTEEWLRYVMNNYNIVEKIVYRKEEKSREMVVYIMKLKYNNKLKLKYKKELLK
jgi:hypothetical protein